MTCNEILNRAGDNLYDEGLVRFTETALLDSIQDGYDELALLTGAIERVTTVNFQANLNYYTMSSYISDYYRPIACWNTDNNRWLDPIPYSEFDDYFGGRWETLTGVPTLFTILGWETLVLARKKSTTSGNFLHFYKARADTLTLATTPTLPSELHHVLVDYAVGDLLDYNLEYTKSMKYFANYQEGLQKIKRQLNSRALPDRLHTLMMVHQDGTRIDTG